MTAFALVAAGGIVGSLCVVLARAIVATSCCAASRFTVPSGGGRPDDPYDTDPYRLAALVPRGGPAPADRAVDPWVARRLHRRNTATDTATDTAAPPPPTSLSALDEPDRPADDDPVATTRHRGRQHHPAHRITKENP